MLIWAILIGSFIAGAVVSVRGKLKTSKRRQIVGRNARLVGIGLMALPFVVFLSIILGAWVSLQLRSSIESADTYGNMVGILLLALIAILFAASVKRLSVPIAPRSVPMINIGGVSANQSETISANGQSKSGQAQDDRKTNVPLA